MAHDPEEENKLRQYLLGEMAFAEQVLVEQRLFLEDDYAEVAQAVEDDLIDDYLHDDLTPYERMRFEGRFLKGPERTENLRIADALSRYIAPTTFVAPPYAAQFLERHRSRHTEAQPGSSLSELGAVAHLDDIATYLREESPTTSAESPKQNTKFWFFFAAAILIVLCIVLWLWNRFS